MNVLSSQGEKGCDKALVPLKSRLCCHVHEKCGVRWCLDPFSRKVHACGKLTCARTRELQYLHGSLGTVGHKSLGGSALSPHPAMKRKDAVLRATGLSRYLY